MDYKYLDVHVDEVTFEEIIAKQGDIASRFLIMRIIENGSIMNLTGRTVRAYGVKPDNKLIYNDCEITDAVNGIATLEFTSQMLSTDGKLEIELVIMEGKKKLSTVSFFVTVIKSINSDEAIESTDEFTALTIALATVDEFNTRIKALENGKFDKKGGVISGATEVTGKLKGNLEHARDYFNINSFNPSTYGDDSYLQTWYNPNLKAFNISARNKEGGSLQYVDIKNNGENMVSDGHAYTWKAVQTFNEITSYLKQLRCHHYITFFDHAKTNFNSKVAQMFFNASANMLTFQPRVSEAGNITDDLNVNIKGTLRLNGSTALTKDNINDLLNIGKVTPVTSETTNQEVEERYLGNGNYMVNIYESFGTASATSMSVQSMIPSIYKSIDEKTINCIENKGNHSDALYANVGIEKTVKTGNNFYITVQLTEIYASPQRVYINLSFVARK